MCVCPCMCVCLVLHIYTYLTDSHTLEDLKAHYEKVANKIHRHHGVASRNGIDCSLKQHRATWKKMDEARLVCLIGLEEVSGLVLRGCVN